MTRSAPITVCIGTYGDTNRWSRLVNQRAKPSVERQTVAPAKLCWRHGANLHDARNSAAAEATSDWLCFLDADDELDPGYLAAMTTAIEQGPSGDLLLQPATLGVHPDGREDPAPYLIPPKPLHVANFLIIGTLVRREQFQRVGAFRDWPIFEDWDLWLRCHRDGATILPVPGAIYRVHVNTNGRNHPSADLCGRTYQRIRGLYATPPPARRPK